jgi:DNA topoisomerase-2
LGLRYGLDYKDDKNFKTLKYGKLMTICDSDVDGLHIGGLIINYIRKLFPSLLDRTESYLVSMWTPIAKINTKPKPIVFYDEREYNEYMYNTINKIKKGECKYYKGLGSSNITEVEETFGQKIVEYIKDDNIDETLNKVFLKTNADDRKTWLEDYDPLCYKMLNNNEQITQMNVSDFFNNYMIQFSIADCGRNIPNIMDGLKTSQRKVLYSCFKRNLTSEIKVSQLAGYVSEHSNYHHGESSLYSTITHMASCFVGSNNLPLLTRGGMFGSRLSADDCGAPRYIFTKLEAITRKLFPSEDDILLKRVIDDGDMVEPEFYPCIIPFILANPCNGAIGTGWSSKIPGYNPIDLCDCVEEWINSDGNTINENGEYKYKKLIPWYRGFKGIIEEDDKQQTRYISKGIIERNDKGVIIKELPIGLWTEDFKEKLEDMLENKTIADIKNYSNPIDVHFEIKELEDGVKCNEENLKLKEYLHVSNLVAFTEKGKLRKFNTVYEIIDEFCKVRYTYYILRKKHIISEYTCILKILKNKRRFIQEIIDDILIIFKQDDETVIKNIESRNFDKDDKDSYDYLLSIQTKSYTKKKLDELDKEINKYEKLLEDINNTSVKQLWINDIEDFKKEYNKFLENIEKEENNLKIKNKKTEKVALPIKTRNIKKTL